ncbi:MAG: cytochrome b/b6 domain-containing protein [Magnetococcus sp. YQC-5]
MHYDRFTRLLHIVIACGIMTQMVGSLVMIHPKPGRQGDLFYAMHETWGQVVLGVLVIHWIWSMVRPGSIAFAQLFPWFSLARYRAIQEDIKQFATHAVRFRLPDATQPSPLASAIHGLGLIVATLLGMSGVILFLGISKNGAMVGWVHAVKEAHEVFGSVLWVYLMAHACMGILHQLSGHGSMIAMIKVWKKNPSPLQTSPV